jgi:hypothetical protein
MPRGLPAFLNAQGATRLSKGHITKQLGKVTFGEYRPLGRLTSFAVTDDRLYVGTADSALVDVYARDGRRIGGRCAASQFDKAQLRSINELVASLPSGDVPESQKQELLKIPVPEHLPAYTDGRVCGFPRYSLGGDFGTGRSRDPAPCARRRRARAG